MPSRLADRLSAARRRRFVGRGSELALFESALTAPMLPFHVLYIFGPGGVGKTTLLGAFAALCDEQSDAMRAWTLDARNIDPVPEIFLAALQAALEVASDVAPVEAIAADSRRTVLLIDTYELLAPLDGWLRDVFVPQLPDNVLVVLAGRQPPALPWRIDTGWQALLRVMPLRNLSPEESRAYLSGRVVPLDQHQTVLDFTHGHPLALSLVADVIAQRGVVVFQPEAAPDVIETLLGQFVQKSPDPTHRAALEVCALVRLTTEPLLAHVLGLDDGHEAFNWLRGLSFIESDLNGLFPHDLAREALSADLRWRNPEGYTELHRRIRAYYTSRLPHSNVAAQQRMLVDFTFLHRNNPLVRPFYQWQSGGTMLLTAAQADDWPALLAMVEQHEGAESARYAAHWFQLQPGGVTVIRDAESGASGGTPVGFVAIVALHEATADDLRVDPATEAAWQYLTQHAPLRPGEGATLFRFWMARDTYQGVSAAQSLIGVHMLRHYLTTPWLACSFFACANPFFWAPLSVYADLQRLTEAEFTVGGRRYGVYGHDWRTVPPLAWLALLGDRELSVGPVAPRPATTQPLVVLSQQGFLDAVHQALREVARPEGLRGNPLLRSRLVVERAGATASDAQRCATLQSLITEASETLKASPRDLKLYRAVYHTYLHPSGTHEQTAELLDVPFSTFRRHLKTGAARVAELLWQWELQG